MIRPTSASHAGWDSGIAGALLVYVQTPESHIEYKVFDLLPSNFVRDQL